MIEYCVDDVIDLRQSSSTTALGQQRLGDWRQLVVSKQLHLLDLLVGDGMEKLSGVHLGTEQKRLVQIPGTSDTSQKIIANSRTYFAECIGIKRWYDENICPLYELQVQALFVEAFGDLPLALIREDLRHRWDLIDVDEVLCSFS